MKTENETQIRKTYSPSVKVKALEISDFLIKNKGRFSYKEVMKACGITKEHLWRAPKNCAIEYGLVQARRSGKTVQYFHTDYAVEFNRKIDEEIAKRHKESMDRAYQIKRKKELAERAAKESSERIADAAGLRKRRTTGNMTWYRHENSEVQA